MMATRSEKAAAAYSSGRARRPYTLRKVILHGMMATKKEMMMAFVLRVRHSWT